MEKLNLFKKEDYSERMKKILDEAWCVFQHQFIAGMIMTETKNEALFQFHFASIIKTVGNLYAFSDERFYVDLETKWEGEKGKKFIDITCGFKENDVIRYACAIELKFKPRREDSKKTAFPNNMFRIYRDLEFLEKEVGIGLEKKPEGCSLGKQIYSEGRFYFITDNKKFLETKAYNQKENEDGRYHAFGLTENYTEKEVVYHPKKNETEDRCVNLSKPYPINWKEYDCAKDQNSWNFLEIDISE